MKRYFLLANHGLGDVTMMLPLINGMLRSELAEVHVAVKSALEEELLHIVFGKKVPTIHVLPSGRWRRIAFLFLLALRQGRFDYAIVGFNTSYISATLLMAIMRARTKVGSAKSRLSWPFDIRIPEVGIHKSAYCRIQAEAIEVKPKAVTICRDRAPRDGIAIAFGAGKRPASKLMPADSAVDICREILSRNSDQQVYILGDANDMEFNDELYTALQSNRVVNLSGRTSLKELLKLLSKVSRTYTVCNGISHLANLAGCPVTVFYGPTDPHYTGPSVSNLSIVTRGLPCSPCYSRAFRAGCGNPICMKFNGGDLPDHE